MKAFQIGMNNSLSCLRPFFGSRLGRAVYGLRVRRWWKALVSVGEAGLEGKVARVPHRCMVMLQPRASLETTGLSETIFRWFKKRKEIFPLVVRISAKVL